MRSHRSLLCSSVELAGLMAPKGARKRPAAQRDTWLVKEEPDAQEEGPEDPTEDELEVQPRKKAPPNRHEDDDSGAPAPGEPDPRQTSLAQRHVFKTSRHLIAKEVLEKYDFYKSKECKEKGKEKMANEIINAHVPRKGTDVQGNDVLVRRLS